MLGYLKTHDKNSLKLYDIDRILAIALSIGTTYDETKRLFDIYCGFNLDGENNIAKKIRGIIYWSLSNKKMDGDDKKEIVQKYFDKSTYYKYKIWKESEV